MASWTVQQSEIGQQKSPQASSKTGINKQQTKGDMDQLTKSY